MVELSPYGHPSGQAGYQVRGDRVYRTDAYGIVRTDQPSLRVGGDGRIVELNAYGHPQYRNGGYRIKDGKVYRTDAYGNLRDTQPALTVTPKPRTRP